MGNPPVSKQAKGVSRPEPFTQSPNSHWGQGNYAITGPADTTITTYTYEDYNRKTETVTLNSTITKQRTHSYDETNWLTLIVDDTDPANPLTIAYTYDNNGNTLTKTDSSLTNQDLAFVYDAANRLVETRRGPPSSETILGRYDYNYAGFRIRHLLSERGDVDYYYDATAVIEEHNAADGSLLAHYRYADRLISLDTGSTKQYYHHDALGSTVNLTDESAAVQVSYKLDPWGMIRDQQGTSVNRQIFTGQEHDENTGLIYFGARYYDPDTARFISQDSYLGESNVPPSLHRYLYAYSNPTVYVDLLGYASAFITGNVADNSDWFTPVSNREYDSGNIVADGLNATYDSILNIPAGIGNIASKALYEISGVFAIPEQMLEERTGISGDQIMWSSSQIPPSPVTTPIKMLGYSAGGALKTATKISKTRHLFSKVKPAISSLEKSIAKITAEAVSGAKDHITDFILKKQPQVIETPSRKSFPQKIKEKNDNIANPNAKVISGLAEDASKKPIVIGENMKRVNAYADKIGGETIDSWLAGRKWSQELNDEFISTMKAQGREIKDIGPDFSRRLQNRIDPTQARGPSSVYGTERRELLDYGNYERLYERTGKYQGGVPGFDN